MTQPTAKVAGPKITSKMSDKDLMGLLDKLIAERGGQELSLERLIWKAESCGQFAVVGHIINIVDMPKADREDNPDWKAFIFRTTYETRGVNRNGDVVPVAAGQEIVVPANYQLAANLARFALDPEFMHELGITAKDRTAIGGGKKMWNFRVVVMPEGAQKRTGVYLLPEAIKKELPAGDVANTETEAAAS